MPLRGAGTADREVVSPLSIYLKTDRDVVSRGRLVDTGRRRRRSRWRSVKARTLGGVLLGMAAAVGARPYPEPESEDRALRRLPGLKPDDLDEAVRSHHRSIDGDGF